MNTLATHTPQLDLTPKNADKDTAHRIAKFTTWLNDTGRNWTQPDLAVYRDKLLEDYAPSTVSAHLSTVRAQYGRLLRDNKTRDLLFDVAATKTGSALKRSQLEQLRQHVRERTWFDCGRCQFRRRGMRTGGVRLRG